MAASGSIARLIRGAPAPPPPGNVTPLRDTLSRAGSGLDEQTATITVTDPELDLARAERMGTDDLMDELRRADNDADEHKRREDASRSYAMKLRRILRDRVSSLIDPTRAGEAT
jgi:hypothetical protein